MKKASKQKIQQLLINHLLEEGQIELILPDGMVLELGLTQENRQGDLEIAPDYCWLIAHQHDRTVSMDSYNLGLRYSQNSDKVVCEQEALDHNGENVVIFDLV